MTEELQKLRNRAEREKRARKEAEALLEGKSLELYRANELLKRHAQSLETEVAERTVELKAALAKAEAATEAKSAFLAAVSHEIRTPLNGILGIAELMALDVSDPSLLRQIRILQKSGRSLLTIVNDLLDFTKIEAGHLKLEELDFDLLAELQSTVALYLPNAQERGIVLRETFAALPKRVKGDALRLRQIVGNLLSNAIKFTSEGEVVLHAESIKTTDGLWQITISVKDSGVGIPLAIQPHLFAPFTQAESSTTRRFGGTGLGLAIVKRLINAMSGEISLKSSPGNGSEFTCIIPFTESQHPAHSLPDTTSWSIKSQINGLRILLVEDNEINQIIASEVLSHLGCDADVAGSAVEGIEKVKSTPYDVIFMDLQMPGMDGLEATRIIRSLDLKIRPWIIALTANVLDDDKDRCFEAGMDAFLTKPLDLNQIQDQLNALVRTTA